MTRSAPGGPPPAPASPPTRTHGGSGGSRHEAPRRGPPADLYFYTCPTWTWRTPATPAHGSTWFCLDPPIAHPELGPHASCSHYTGQSFDLPARQAAHGASACARLLAYQRARGGTWHIARTWKGGRWEERGIKDWRNGPLRRRRSAREPARPARRRHPRRGVGLGTGNARTAPAAPGPRRDAPLPRSLASRHPPSGAARRGSGSWPPVRAGTRTGSPRPWPTSPAPTATTAATPRPPRRRWPPSPQPSPPYSSGAAGHRSGAARAHQGGAKRARRPAERNRSSEYKHGAGWAPARARHRAREAPPQRA